MGLCCPRHDLTLMPKGSKMESAATNKFYFRLVALLEYLYEISRPSRSELLDDFGCHVGFILESQIGCCLHLISDILKNKYTGVFVVAHV